MLGGSAFKIEQVSVSIKTAMANAQQTKVGSLAISAKRAGKSRGHRLDAVRDYIVEVQRVVTDLVLLVSN